MPLRFRFSATLVIWLICLVHLATGAAQACDCESPPNAAQAFNDHDAVFVGVIVDQEPGFLISGDPSPRSVNFDVLQSWKGVVGTEVGVLTSSGGSAACGLDNAIGEKLLIYATTNADEETLMTGLCAVRLFDCPYDGCQALAEEQIAEFSRLNIEELALRDGLDPSYPPHDLSSDAPGRTLCGTGLGLWTVLCAAGWFVRARTRRPAAS